MCGIAGIIAISSDAPPVDRAELERIRDTMAARGPDSFGTWLSPDSRAGFAHRRLSIIDPSDAGHQPMSTNDGRLLVVFNGAIYNHNSLRDTLSKKGYRFRSLSDTEVLLHLYADKGREMVHQLRGMYAFAIFDQERRELFLARDPFGIKPLYYSDDGRTLRFASQVKALLAGGSVPRTIDYAGQTGFFLWGNVPEPYTLYKAIRSVPAGTTLTFDGSGKRDVRMFFNMADEFAVAEERSSTVDQGRLQTTLSEVLTDTVRHHLVADVPVGVFLSSGIDSTTLTTVAGAISNATLETITIGFDAYKNTDHDETGLSKHIAEMVGTKHRERWISKNDFEYELPRLFTAMDQPSVDGINSYFVSKAAAEAGMKVALSGLGGDEFFRGYPSFQQIPRLVNRVSAVRSFPGLGKAFRRTLAPFLKRITSPKYAGVLEFGGTVAGAYLLRRALYMPWELSDVIDPDIARMGLEELSPLDQLNQTIRGIASRSLQVAALELSWYMRNQLLKDTDWASMSHSLEVRVPYVDVEVFRAIAPLMASERPPTKSDLAQVAAKPLPRELLMRKKTGFAVPVREWLLSGAAPRNLGSGLRAWAERVWSAQIK